MVLSAAVLPNEPTPPLSILRYAVPYPRSSPHSYNVSSSSSSTTLVCPSFKWNEKNVLSAGKYSPKNIKIRGVGRSGNEGPRRHRRHFLEKNSTQLYGKRENRWWPGAKHSANVEGENPTTVLHDAFFPVFLRFIWSIMRN